MKKDHFVTRQYTFVIPGASDQLNSHVKSIDDSNSAVV